MAAMTKLAGLFLLVCTIAVLTQNLNALSCPKCDKTKCTPPEGCKFGIVDNACGCCQICGKGLGEECQGVFGQLGFCGQDLACQIPPNSSQRVGKCVPKSEVVTFTSE